MLESEPTWLSIAPPLVAILSALVLRKVVVALGVGVFFGALVVCEFRPLLAVARAGEYLWGAVADGGHQWILAFALLLGGLMRILRDSGGSMGMARRLTRVARTRRGGQLTAWGMGLVFFFDDYANTLFVGSSMRPIAARLGISREKLAFIVDATAAPVASLAPISSWIAVEIGYIGDQLRALDISGDPYALFLATIPMRFYSIFMLALGVMIALGGRDFGPMLQAERAAQASLLVAREREAPPANTAGDRGSSPASWRLAALPLALVLLSVVIGLYVTGSQGARAAGLPLTASNILTNASSSKSMTFASLLGGIVAMVMTVRAGRMGVREVVTNWGRGALAMAPVAVVLLLAWSLGAVCHDMHTAAYLVRILGADFDAGLLPAAVFIVSALVSFATGTSWGTMGIIFPLAVPLAHELAPGHEALLLGTLSSILAGSVFGDHCSPISDTTIMSALATGCDQIAHVRTQLPYALLAAAVAVSCGSLPVGLGLLDPWLALPFGLLVLFLCLRLLSHRGRVQAAVAVE